MRLPGSTYWLANGLIVMAFAEVAAVRYPMVGSVGLLGWALALGSLAAKVRGRLPHDGAYALCCRPCSRKRPATPRTDWGRVAGAATSQAGSANVSGLCPKR